MCQPENTANEICLRHCQLNKLSTNIPCFKTMCGEYLTNILTINIKLRVPD